MRIFKRLILLLLFFHQYVCLPAFPGAEGFGSETIGGRGGRVIVVQNTNGDGPGSLHEALMAKGPRIITFRVGGTITFPKTTVVSEPFVTILGQTAPGEGITVTAVGAVKGEVFSIRTNDVIIRHMRFRAGPSTDPACCRDALTVYRGSNVVLDHITVSWGTDENISSAFSANNITWSNSMSAEALYNSNHEDDPNKPGSVEAHSMGALWSSASSLSIHHTLFTRNNGRNPRVADIRGIIDLRYNYVYQATNTIQLGTVSEKTTVCTAVNIVGCLIHEGSSSRNGVLIARHHDNPYCLYVKNNIGQHRPTPDLPEMNFVGSSSQSEDRIPSEFISTPHKAPAITRNPFGGSADSMNNDVREYALKHAGCTKPQRDADDKRVIEHVRNKNSGKRVDAPPNGIRQLPAGTPRADQDKDGLPDSVEASFGLKANEADSHRIDAATGYAYIELWANGKDLLGDEYVAPIVSTGQTPAVTPSTTKSTIIAPTQTPASTTPAPSPSTFEFQWGAAPSSSNPKLACTTASGAKMSFQATFDDAGIHIAAVITGDSTMFTPNDNNGKLYQDDALEMIFDVAKTGEQSLTPGSYKIMVSRAGKVRASEAYTVHDNGAELVLTAGTTSTSNGWQATALIRWTALQSAEDAASLSSADAAANSAIRFHVRLIDGETLEEQTTCDAPAQLDDVRQINQPELYATARFGAKQQVTSTSKNTGDTSTSKPVVATPVYTTTANLYETFTIPPDSQCEQFPRTVGCPCTLDVERPCASSSLVCVDLGNEARCARLRESTSPQTEPLVSLAMHLSLSITCVVGGIVWQLLN